MENNHQDTENKLGAAGFYSNPGGRNRHGQEPQSPIPVIVVNADHGEGIIPKITSLTQVTHKHFDIGIKQGDQTYSQTYELDKSIAYIRGLKITSNRMDLVMYRGSQKIEINRLEIFPEGYPSTELMSTMNVPVDHRYADMKRLPVGNGQVKVDYRDFSDSRAPFEPYTVTVHLFCELK